MSDCASAGDPREGGHHRSPWMKPEAAAEYLGIALGTLRNWTSARFVPFSRRGRIVRYHRGTLDRWLSQGSCPGRKTIVSTQFN